MALTFDDTQAAELLDALGLPANTTDATTVMATVKDAAMASIAEGAQPSAVMAAARLAGLEAIDSETLNSMRREVAEARQTKVAAEQKRIDDAVNDAVAKGKITAARKKHWVTLIGADPAMADVLAGIPNETAVPMNEIGHGVDASADWTNDDAQQNAWFY